MQGDLNWVVALMPEAQVVIDAFQLRRIESKSGVFPVYEARDGAVRLVISGIGKVNAAAATAVLASTAEPGQRGGGWINFGIAGCSESRFGTSVLASKITDGGTGRSWYPVATWPKRCDLPRLILTTVERPVFDYSRVDGLVEMEAAGFYPIALRQSSVELAQVVKVVSDDPDHPVAQLKRETVAGLCAEAWPGLQVWLDAFREILVEESRRAADPEGLSRWLSRYRFSVTQQHQLKRLLQEWEALTGRPAPEPPASGDAGSSLRALRDHLAEARLPEDRLPEDRLPESAAEEIRP